MDKYQSRPWFVAQLRPNGLRQAKSHLARQGFETFAPVYRMEPSAATKAQRRETAVFPGYIFVSFDPEFPGWTAINSTRGIVRLLLSDPLRPRALPSAFIAGLASRCEGDGVIRRPDALDSGDRVRILSGPFADVIAKIERIPDRERIEFLLEIMGQRVPVSVARGIIEKL